MSFSLNLENNPEKIRSGIKAKKELWDSTDYRKKDIFPVEDLAPKKYNIKTKPKTILYMNKVLETTM